MHYTFSIFLNYSKPKLSDIYFPTIESETDKLWMPKKEDPPSTQECLSDPSAGWQTRSSCLPGHAADWLPLHTNKAEGGEGGRWVGVLCHQACLEVHYSLQTWWIKMLGFRMGIHWYVPEQSPPLNKIENSCFILPISDWNLSECPTPQ